MKFKTVIKVKPTGKYLNGQSQSFWGAFKEYLVLRKIYKDLNWMRIYILPNFIPTGDLKIDWKNMGNNNR